MKEVRTKILDLKVFAYIVEETRGVNSKFIILACSPTGPPAVTALLKNIFYYVNICDPF